MGKYTRKKTGRSNYKERLAARGLSRAPQMTRYRHATEHAKGK